MRTIVIWTRAMLAALLLAVIAPTISAKVGDQLSPGTSKSRPAGTQATTPDEPATALPRNGSPEMGLLILIGGVAFIILVAWLIARVGDDNRPRGDGTLS